MSGDKQKRKSLVARLIPGFIRRDFWRKFIALAFAIIVWNRVSVKLDEEVVLRHVPVEVIVPSGYIRTDDAKLSVNVVLKGSKNRLTGLDTKNVTIKVKPRFPKIDDNKITLSPRNVSAPSDVTVVSVDPDVVAIRLDRKMVKEVPVKLIITGMLLEDYAFRMSSMIPDSVTVSGPSALVERVASIRTEPVVLKKENVEDFECSVKLRHSSELIVEPDSVTARIEIYKNRDSRAFDEVPLKPYGFIPSGCALTFKPEKVSILVEGSKRAVELTTSDDLKPFIDLSAIKGPGKWRLDVKCWLNDKEISVKEIKPSTVEVVLEKKVQGNDGHRRVPPFDDGKRIREK